MSTFWSLWIIVLTFACLILCAGILWWCLKDKMGVEEGQSMGHSFDGIEELNNPLPRWWSIMFIVTFIFGLGYLALYPGLGNFGGLLGWKSSNQGILSLEQSRAEAAKGEGIVQYDREVAMKDARFAEVLKPFVEKPIAELAYDPEGLRIGQRLFLQNCAQCHGSDARGGTGFPNLTDGAWLYGGEPETIRQTLLHGRQGVMPGWSSMGEQAIEELASYVLSLSGRKVNDKEAQAGKLKFAVCAACHGADGKGNKALGAPNLTDNIWLYGGSRSAVLETLRNGRNGVMPAWKDILGEDKVHIISAYVYRLSNPEKPAE
ncbi:cytochrome-c oxidase, cbb3-type subunit III [Corallincola holothuriorum]|uniref:Cbb3-type cytochrome c oxidase subunit n=1 Tax=Corallincola holothuriorum TaxID=2282215 RepID=A0A368NTZ0_9GAMM|nr:cytochrome-c oxidase, cbb3-type subunit III [Corallincola holothuriorum]RCU52681.1 cytochrome-c oxidase, cbb3-type subunit III [Corallincola holothuriorum]